MTGTCRLHMLGVPAPTAPPSLPPAVRKRHMKLGGPNGDEWDRALHDKNIRRPQTGHWPWTSVILSWGRNGALGAKKRTFLFNRMPLPLKIMALSLNIFHGLRFFFLRAPPAEFGCQNTCWEESARESRT